MGNDMLTSLRLIAGTMLVCAVIYPTVVLGFGQAVVPTHANGSLIRSDDGTVIGSRLIAPEFRRPEHNGAAAGGSNLAASNPTLRQRASGHSMIPW